MPNLLLCFLFEKLHRVCEFDVAGVGVTAPDHPAAAVAYNIITSSHARIPSTYYFNVCLSNSCNGQQTINLYGCL